MPKTPAEDQVKLGTAVESIPLSVSPAVADALELCLQALRDDARLYHDVELAVWKLQRHKGEGPLSDLLAALVGKE